jgi:hypothetical protein
VVRFNLYDGDGDGGTSADYDVTVTVQGVNDAPVIYNINSADSDYFYEKDGSPTSAYILDSKTVDAKIDDEDDTLFDGGKLTVQIVEGFDADEDRLWIENEGMGYRDIGVDLTDTVKYSGQAIGDVDYYESSGLLEVSLSGQYAGTEAISSLIQNITYNNIDSDDPTEGERLIRFVMWDSHGASSDALDNTVIVRGVNDAPDIYNMDGDTLTYTEGDGQKRLDVDGDAYVEDVDTTEFGSGSLYFVVDGAEWDVDTETFNDRLNIMNEGTGFGQILFGGFDEYLGTGDVLYNGERIGVAERDVDGGTSWLNIDFNNKATEESVTALIQAVTFENVNSVDPTEGERTVRFIMNDGHDGSSEGRNWISEAWTDWGYITVNVQGVNDAPVIENLAGETLTYYKNSGLISLDHDSNAAVTDSDSADYNGGKLTVQITNDVAQDTLGIITAADSISLVGNDVYYDSRQIGKYTLNADGDNLVVNLTSQATDREVTELVKSIGYENIATANINSSFDRNVRFQLEDGDGGVSSLYSVKVDVQGNQPPVVIDAIPDEIVNADFVNRWTINEFFEDPDDTQITFTAERVDADGLTEGDGKLPNWMMLTDSGTFMANPPETSSGNEIHVKVFATDPDGASAETTFTVTVSEAVVNHAPNLVRVDADGQPVYDPDDTAHPIIDPSVSFTISEHEEITGDGESLTDVTGRKVMVQGWDVDDGDQATLEYRITGGNGSANFNIDPDSGVISLAFTGETTDGPGETGDDLNFETGPKAFDLYVEVKDSGGLTDVGTVTIFVQDENDAPEPIEIPLPVQEVTAGDAFVFDIEDEDEPFFAFTDEDQDHLTYRAQLSSGASLETTGWLNFSSDQNQFMGFVPANAQVDDTWTIELFADDGEDETSVTFDIKIVASLDHELRDALRYLDQVGEDEYILPAEDGDMEINQVMVAENQAPAEVDAEMLEVLALLDGGFDSGYEAQNHTNDIA